MKFIYLSLTECLFYFIALYWSMFRFRTVQLMSYEVCLTLVVWQENWREHATAFFSKVDSSCYLWSLSFDLYIAQYCLAYSVWYLFCLVFAFSWFKSPYEVVSDCLTSSMSRNDLEPTSSFIVTGTFWATWLLTSSCNLLFLSKASWIRFPKRTFNALERVVIQSPLTLNQLRPL